MESLKKGVHVFGVLECMTTLEGSEGTVMEDVGETWEEGALPSYHSDLLYCIIF